MGNNSSKNILLKFSFLSNDQKNETETHQIDMKQFIQNSKSAKQFSFSTKLKNIGKPEHIRLQIHITQDDDDDDDEDIKWHLDYVDRLLKEF
jgi:hypothetical protein